MGRGNELADVRYAVGPLQLVAAWASGVHEGGGGREVSMATELRATAILPGAATSGAERKRPRAPAYVYVQASAHPSSTMERCIDHEEEGGQGGGGRGREHW
jgi:hypothetical protein